MGAGCVAVEWVLLYRECVCITTSNRETLNQRDDLACLQLAATDSELSEELNQLAAVLIFSQCWDRLQLRCS